MNISAMKIYGAEITELTSILPESHLFDGKEQIISWYLLGMNRIAYCYAENVDEARSITKMIRGIWEKKTDEYNFILSRTVVILENIWRIEVNITRDEVCEQVQVGTRKVERPDPNVTVPMVEVEEPIYEWKCPEVIFGGSAD
jgi:hypothetical protein